MHKFEVDKDIRKAQTLPATFYRSNQVYEALTEAVLLPSWQYIGSEDLLPKAGYAHPYMLLEGSLDEPLLLVRDRQDNIYNMSNVCTHRGMFLVDKPGPYRMLSCKYHGRCFNLDGQFRSMPEFKEVENFPAETDHLTRLDLQRIGKLLFSSVRPEHAFSTVFEPLLERMKWFDFDALVYDEAGSDIYTIDTHWALYCDNYLEGFHVPFVHPSLNEQLDYGEYETELFPYCNLQLGVASEDAVCFDLPTDSPDYGKGVFAYYWWVYPNLMLNFYTWGLSVNIVEPQGLDKTRVVFKTFRFQDERGAGFDKQSIHDTELEDEEVVERVHKGLKSRLYSYGRFSPKREQGVHHFQRLLSEALKASGLV